MTSCDGEGPSVILEESGRDHEVLHCEYDTLAWQGLQAGIRLPKLGCKQ